MERNIPQAAYIVIGCLIGVFFLLNISLWNAWKRKGENQTINILKKSGLTLRKPWQKEDEQLEKLAVEAAKLRERKEGDSRKENDDTQN